MTTTPTITTDDFRATKTFAAAPDAVFSALTDIDALTAWWTPAAGGGEELGQGVRTGAVRAVEKPNGTETLLEQLRHGRVGFPR